MDQVFVAVRLVQGTCITGYVSGAIQRVEYWVGDKAFDTIVVTEVALWDRDGDYVDLDDLTLSPEAIDSLVPAVGNPAVACRQAIAWARVGNTNVLDF
jgi:hypothetical protein